MKNSLGTKKGHLRNQTDNSYIGTSMVGGASIEEINDHSPLMVNSPSSKQSVQQPS
jgi:hypothetical protein